MKLILFVMRKKTGHRGGLDRHGQVLVEFALMLPLLMLLIAAIVDFGFLFYDNISTQGAAREGARLMIRASALSVPLVTDAQIKEVIKQAHGPYNQILDGEIKISLDLNSTEFGTPAKIGRELNIAHKHDLILPIMVPFGESIVLRARVKAFLVPGLGAP